VLFGFQAARRAPEYGFMKMQANGGYGAVSPSIKSMQSMGFFSWRDGTPVKPGFLRSKKCAQVLTSKNCCQEKSVGDGTVFLDDRF
jgi:hypothetical protein